MNDMAEGKHLGHKGWAGLDLLRMTRGMSNKNGKRSDVSDASRLSVWMGFAAWVSKRSFFISMGRGLKVEFLCTKFKRVIRSF